MWVKAHTSSMKKAQMAQQKRQISTTNDQADELVQSGAALDGAEVAEQVSKEADKAAATFHCDVEDLGIWT